MDRKTLLLLCLALVVIVVAIMIFFNPQKSYLSSPVVKQQQANLQIQPSETLKEYQDPSGFTFSYPDNLSLVKNEVADGTYADIDLTAKGLIGNLVLKISDTNFASLDEWIKVNKSASSETPKEVQLETLKALEMKTKDRLLLVALDQGVLFTIEIPLEKEDFWMKVLNIILADFSFAPPTQDSTTEEVTFEGEEIVE